MHTLHGIAVSPGIAIGEAMVFDNEGYRIPRRFVSRDAVDQELGRLSGAMEAAAVEVETNRTAVHRQLGEQYAAIFEAHLQILRDNQLRVELDNVIRKESCSAEVAVSRVLRRYAKIFQNLEHTYLAERAADIYDIEKCLLRNLLGIQREELKNLTSPVLVLAHDLTPGETAQLDRRFVRGLVTEAGSSGSHTAIMAAALGIPCVVGTGRFMTDVAGGDLVIIDGDHGQVILGPDNETLSHYHRLIETQRRNLEQMETLTHLTAETIDHVRLQLLSNIEFPQEVHECVLKGSDGVGLYRTEFLYLGSQGEPTEEEQYQAYLEVIQTMGDKPVVIRSLDLGADKLPEVAMRFSLPEEKNPFLGLRSIRLSLRNLDMFRAQLRAVLRASVAGNARLMFPLVSTVGELRQAKRVLADVCEDLEEEGVPFRADLPVGIMVEVPATVMTIERFIPEVDFFSIGTNDLIQYTLAVDRGNKEVAGLYSASDPSVLRLIQMVVQAGKAGAVPVSVCGQMSSHPIYTMLLLGLGLRQLSVPPSAHAEIKMVCRSVTLPQCEAVAARAMALENARDVTRYLQEELKKVLPQLVV